MEEIGNNTSYIRTKAKYQFEVQPIVDSTTRVPRRRGSTPPVVSARSEPVPGVDGDVDGDVGGFTPRLVDLDRYTVSDPPRPVRFHVSGVPKREIASGPTFHRSRTLVM